jgi:L-ascorbate metabolism protein UlaG (beta-lactamase superfamily)
LRRSVKAGRKYLNPVPTAIGGLGLALKLLPQFLTNRAARAPRTPLGPFQTDAGVYGTPPASGLRITWMGHSSSLMEIDGVRILIDPVWDLRASPLQWAGPKRFFAPPLKLEELPRLDAVLISHDHYDHLGEETVGRLRQLQPAVRWVTSLDVGAELRQMGVPAGRITELDWTKSVKIIGEEGAVCEVTSLPSRHFSGRSAFNRFETLWASFVLRGAKHNVYYGADSGWWEGFAEIGAAYGPFDLTMLEIGAYNDLWRQIHLGPDNAARAFRELGGAGLLMPIHWGLFDLALHAWEQPIERMRELADAQALKLWQPEPGRPTDVVAGVEVRSDWWR